MMFLKTAGLDYAHSQWRVRVDQLNLESGVVLLCDPDDSNKPGLGYIDLTNETLWQAQNEEVLTQ